MMIHCEACGKKYNIDEKKITKPRSRLKCPNCKNTIEVLKPKQNSDGSGAIPEPSSLPPDKNAVPDKTRATQKTGDMPAGDANANWEIDQAESQQGQKATGLTIGNKLLILFLAFIVITGAVLTIVYLNYVPSLMREQINLRTYSISQSFSTAIQQPLLIKNYLLVNKTAETNAKLPGVAYVSVLNKRGIVIAGILGDRKRFSAKFSEKVKTSGFPKEISQKNRIPSGKKESALDFSVGGQKIHDVAVMIGDTGGEAHVGLFTEDAEKAVRKSLTPLMALLVAIALLGSLSFSLVARTISRPIKALTLAAEKISLGEIDLAIQVKGGGEIGELVASLERMRFSIKAAIVRLQRR